MKICQVGAELFHADGQSADITKLLVAFRHFANATNETSYSLKMATMMNSQSII